MVPIPFENKDTTKYSFDYFQMREELHGHSLFEFIINDQNQIEKAFNQPKQTAGKIRDCLINELETERYDKWLKPEGDIGLNNFFSNPLHLSVKDDNTKNQAKDIVEQMVERQIHSEALFQSLDLMLKCDTT